MKDYSAYIRKNIRELTPYSSARSEYKGTEGIFLDANENPYDNGYNRYPDPLQIRLKGIISGIKGIPSENIFIGNGSDEAIDLCYRIFCEPRIDNAVAIAPSYGMYKVAAAVNDISFREVQLEESFSLPVDGLLSAADGNTKLMFLCSPNNPTGNAFPKEKILYLVEHFDGMVVVDEAYIDFSSQQSLLDELESHPNLIILQTLSKAWGMAGLRLGLAYASKDLIRVFSSVKYPYNINIAGMRAAFGLLGRDITKEVSELKHDREILAGRLGKISCVREVYPSDANFLLVKVDDAKGLYKVLSDKKMIVRDRSSVPGCEGCLRITVGTPEENDCLVDSVSAYCGDDVAEKPAVALDSVRMATVVRNTKETKITVAVDLEGNGVSSINTGLHFFDHMLDQIAHHSGISLRIAAEGDLQVDEHHTMEDVAITLGEALYKALGNKRGIERYGFALPMDDCRAMVLIDLGGRIDFEWDVPFTREMVGDVPTEMFRHFFKSLSEAMHCNLHIVAKGENNHHLAESVFKAFARALRQAVHKNKFSDEIPSSKGMLW